MKFADIKNNIAFRKIFGNAKKTITLISFLNAVLELKGPYRIKTVTLVNPYLLPRLSEEKSSIIDIRATDQRGRRFVVEMQVASKKGFKQRVQYYASRDYSMQIAKGDDYPKLRSTYFIGVINFNIGRGVNYVSRHATTEEETGDNILDDIKYTFIQLTKFDKKEDELVTPIDKWTYFIKNAANLKVIPPYVDDEGLKIAFQEADKHTWEKEELIAYDNVLIAEQDRRGELEFAHEEGLKKGIETGRKEGIEAGRKEERVKAEAALEQMILQLHRNGLPIQTIVAVTSKTEQEIGQILAKYGL